MRRALAAGAIVLAAAVAGASDHADPIALGNLDAGITGLFVFPAGGELTFVLTVHRGLTSPPPYDVDHFEYVIFLDLHSEVVFDNAADVARYGGTVLRPEGISHDAAIRLRLDAEAGLVDGYPRFEGLSGRGARVATGVYDDPFIFPRFFGTNVVAMVIALPMTAFDDAQRHFVVWATSSEIEGDQIDHVGRSNRTQLGRLDFLNTLHPAEQLPALEDRFASGNRTARGFAHLMEHLMPVGAVAGLHEYVLKVRKYDLAPDVLIYSRDRPPGFPNGRRLEDDVAGLTCAQGDCVLQEVAFIEGGWPRRTVNDKPLSTEFPYLAPPHPERPEERHRDRCLQIVLLVLAVVAVVWLWWLRRRARLDAAPYVRPYRRPIDR